MNEGEIISAEYDEPDTVLLRSGALTVTRTQLWIAGVCFPLANVSTMRATRKNYWRWMYSIGALVLIAGFMIGLAGVSMFARATREFDEQDAMAGKVVMIAGVLIFAAGIIMWGMAWQGKWRIVLIISANSGEWASANFNTQAGYNRAASTISGAMAGVGRSVTINALQINRR
jgi:hypothetical protein